MAGAGCAGAGAGEGAADAVLLAPLTEDSFVHNLHARYKRDLIYTWVGSALVSVNPGRALPLYSAELARKYLARPPHLLPPHLYALTAAAYRCVRDRDESQCIIITGESGSGKTEAARVVLQGCILAGGGGGGAGGAGRLLVAAGTLLEAFGNASTARNHNASRFGKLLDIEFDFKGEAIGGNITHSRLKLQRDWQTYRILRADGSPSGGADGADADTADAEHFVHTMDALSHVVPDAGSRAAVLRVLAFVLKLGDVEFEPRQHVDGSLRARAARPRDVRAACDLLGVETGALLRALGADDDEEEDADADADADTDASWAGARRDALVSALYARLFTWLVGACNAALAVEGGGARALGVLDAYGFESLAVNALERLLINYCAERVQACLRSALRREQALYVRDGLPWQPLPVRDQGDVAALLDQGPDSVLGALCACSARGESDDALLTRLARRDHPRLSVLPPAHFQVAHFAGPVVYSATGMTRANRDALDARLGACMRAAAEPLLATLFPAGSPRRAAPLATRQSALLAALARRTAPPHVPPRQVLCLRASPHASSHASPHVSPRASPRAHRVVPRLHLDHLRHQIRTQGVVELALVRRAGWCEARCARALVARYALLSRARRPAVQDPLRAARLLLRQLPLPPGEFAFGHTCVFIRSPRTVWELESWRLARVRWLVRAVQRVWRARAGRARAQGVIARAYRAHRTRARQAAARVVTRALRQWVRRRYLTQLWARLPPRAMSPLSGAWPPCPAPRLLGRADLLLRAAHHRWRCQVYRLRFDQTARNRMREKVTASLLFSGRKASYARSVPHPFVGDYVRLRASAAWRRHAAPHDRYVVFADVVRKVSLGSGRVSRAVLALSTAALLVLEPRALRVRRRVPARQVLSLSLSPHHDALLHVHLHDQPPDAPPYAPYPYAPDEPDALGCLFSGGGGGSGGGGESSGDILVLATHALELAAKLFLVVQHCAGAPPAVRVHDAWHAHAARADPLTVRVRLAQPHAAHAAHAPRIARKHDTLDVLL